MPVKTWTRPTPRDLGARLREARTAAGWTQEQAAQAIGAARTTMIAIEKGERSVKPDELVQLARAYGRKLSWFLAPVPRERAASGRWVRLRQQGFRVEEALHLLGLREHPVDDDVLPVRYRSLAVEAWQRGELSEGQLASFLRVDRLTARRIVQQALLTPNR